MIPAWWAARPLVRGLVIGGIGAVLGGALAWSVADLWFGAKLSAAAAELAKEQTGRAADRTAVANEAAAAAQRNQARVTELMRQIADMDANHVKEMRHAQARLDQLRADVRSGARRLRVAARCVPAVVPGGRGGVPRATPTVGVGDGTTAAAELSGSTSDALLTLAGRADEVASRLRACQDYARAVSARRP